jgi:CRP/FNR family transcriptional regulator
VKNKVIEVDCERCGLDSLCEFLDYGEGELDLPEGTLVRSRTVARGEAIFKEGDTFRSFIAVKSGSFKSTILTPQDEEKVIGFHLAGEMIGTEGITLGRYSSSARALETSAICELNLENMYKANGSLNELQNRVISILGNEIEFYQGLHGTLIRQSSEQRMAAFLMSIYNRMDKRGTSGTDFRLSMSRSDIASYLGLASETVSRILMKLQKLGMINIRNKQVQIADLGFLEEMASSG